MIAVENVMIAVRYNDGYTIPFTRNNSRAGDRVVVQTGCLGSRRANVCSRLHVDRLLPQRVALGEMPQPLHLTSPIAQSVIG